MVDMARGRDKVLGNHYARAGACLTWRVRPTLRDPDRGDIGRGRPQNIALPVVSNVEHVLWGYTVFT